ncbi:MAG: zinc ABC transporter solute-binding protein [Acidimicrobiales bacterium]|nr:zinc ABC transporter solute-binding protein [Acidimicrobiales bacterium]
MIFKVIGKRASLLTVSALIAASGLASCTTNHVANGKISVVAAESEYGDVASQIGGYFVSVYSIENNPNVNPHTFEVSPQVAAQVGNAQVVIENGVGYDNFMTMLESSSPNSSRLQVNAQKLLGLPDNTPNPHLWYDPNTMIKVSNALVADFSKLQPNHTNYFKSNDAMFMNSLQIWIKRLAGFKNSYPDTRVASTEPVANYFLSAAGIVNMTPYSLQANVMNGVDPSPQDVALQDNLITKHEVKILIYNQQVTDPLTSSFVSLAKKNGVPVVGFYETMPTPGFTYQSWMEAELNALINAVSKNISTYHL